MRGCVAAAGLTAAAWLPAAGVAQSCATPPAPLVWESASLSAPPHIGPYELWGPQVRGDARSVCEAELANWNSEPFNQIYTITSCPAAPPPSAPGQLVDISFTSTPTPIGVQNGFTPHTRHDNLYGVAVTACPLYWLVAPAPFRQSSKDGVRELIDPGNGTVHFSETDVRIAGPAGVVAYQRFYNSDDRSGVDGVTGWRHSYSRSIAPRYAPSSSVYYYPGASPTVSAQYSTPAAACVQGFAALRSTVPGWAQATATYRDDACFIARGSVMIAIPPIQAYPLPAPSSTPTAYEVIRDDGQILRFAVQGTEITSPPGISLRLAVSGASSTLTDADGTIETYDSNGVLESIATRAGLTQTLSYDENGQMKGVTDSFGHTLAISRNSQGSIGSISLGGDVLVQYTYDAANRLTDVTKLDGTARSYLYVNGTVANRLQSITDENGKTLASFEYDSSGPGTSSGRPGGASSGEGGFIERLRRPWASGMKTGIALPAAIVAILGAWIAAIYFRRSRNLKTERPADRPEMDLHQIYVSFFSDSSIPEQRVAELWEELAAALKLPPGKLLPTDRFQIELASPQGVPCDDPMSDLRYLISANCLRINIKREEIQTVRDYVLAFGQAAAP